MGTKALWDTGLWDYRIMEYGVTGLQDYGIMGLQDYGIMDYRLGTMEYGIYKIME